MSMPQWHAVSGVSKSRPDQRGVHQKRGCLLGTIMLVSEKASSLRPPCVVQTLLEDQLHVAARLPPHARAPHTTPVGASPMCTLCAQTLIFCSAMSNCKSPHGCQDMAGSSRRRRRCSRRRRGQGWSNFQRLSGASQTSRANRHDRPTPQPEPPALHPSVWPANPHARALPMA